VKPQDGGPWPSLQSSYATRVILIAGQRASRHPRESWRNVRDSFVAKKRTAKPGGWEHRRSRVANAIIIVALGAVVLAFEAWLRKRRRTEA
jgi:cytoskeletal protein RodZ